MKRRRRILGIKKPHVYFSKVFKSWACFDIERHGKGQSPREAYNDYERK